MNIGMRVQTARRGSGLTLRDLAARTGLSASFLSQVERDVVAPSIGSLKQIAIALGVRVADLLAEPATGEGTVVRRAERSVWRLARVRYEQLAPTPMAVAGATITGRDRQMQPQLITFEPGGNIGDHPVSHAGDEFGFVLRGRVECSLEDEVFLLEEGDTIYFDAQRPHRTRNAGDSETTYILVVTPPSF